jgi:putative DNA primase/helicase
MQELFKTRNGRVIMDEDFSSKMYLIKQYHPEWFDRKSTSSGYATYCGLKLKEVL